VLKVISNDVSEQDSGVKIGADIGAGIGARMGGWRARKKLRAESRSPRGPSQHAASSSCTILRANAAR